MNESIRIQLAVAHANYDIPLRKLVEIYKSTMDSLRELEADDERHLENAQLIGPDEAAYIAVHQLANSSRRDRDS